MKIIKSLIILATLTFTLASCSVTAPYMVTQNEMGSKEGKASATFVFGIPVNGGDCSTRTAARNGNITKIATVDTQVKNYLCIVVVRATIVTGN